MITEIIRYKLAPQAVSNFVQSYKSAMKLVDDSGYATGWEILQQQDDHSIFQVIIRWKSKEDHINGFRRSAVFGDFFGLVKPYFESITEMQHYDQV